ncbi:MAG TPA: FAD-dependent monooxygenase [Gemmatimonadales bacterium]|nr:FAD-dependent monooxygenase [Gemmatimonadales bacterium]
MEVVEHLVLGAGPAGLRAAHVLAGAGREVLVLEKNRDVGPKTCAGGLTVKTMRELEAMGLPRDATLRSVGHVAFAGGRPVALDAEATVVHTIPRRDLGRFQLGWARSAGAEVRTGSPVSTIDLAARTITVAGHAIRWTHLIGADGADSAVRRALGLASPREYFAAEYNVPGLRLEPLRVECDPAELANGYFWVFPHAHYTSFGVVAPKHLVAPSVLRRYLDRRLGQLDVRQAGVPFEGATLEVEYRGCHFPGGVHLVGDAAGVVSSLTAEGIYAAIVTGEEVARRILEPGAPAPKTASWLRTKRRHDALARWLARPGPRRYTLGALARLAAQPAVRRPLANWFLRP